MSMASVWNFFSRTRADQQLLNAAKTGNITDFEAALAAGADLFSPVGERGFPLYHKALKHALAARAFDGVGLPMFRALVGHFADQGGLSGDVLKTILSYVVSSGLSADQVRSAVNVLNDAGANFSQAVDHSTGAGFDLFAVSQEVNPASRCSLLANLYWQLLSLSADALRWGAEAPGIVADLFHSEFLRIAVVIQHLESRDIPGLAVGEQQDLNLAVNLLATRFRVAPDMLMSPPGLEMDGVVLREQAGLVVPIVEAPAMPAGVATGGAAVLGEVVGGGAQTRLFEAALMRAGALPSLPEAVA